MDPSPSLQSHGATGSARPHLLLLQADHGAIAAAAPLPLEGCDLFRLDFQDLLLLQLLQLQFLGEEVGGGGETRWGEELVGGAVACAPSLKVPRSSENKRLSENLQ